MTSHYRTSGNDPDTSGASAYIAAELTALAPRLEKRAQLDERIASLKSRLQSAPKVLLRSAPTLSANELYDAYVELAHLEHERADLTQVEAREASLMAEIAAARTTNSTKRRLPNLDAISVAAPCDANWDEMVGTDQARHCRACDKKVFNLSAMTRVEAEVFLESQLVAPCIRFFRRADGTLLTQDCPVGVKRRKRRRAFTSIGLALISLGGVERMLRPSCRHR